MPAVERGQKILRSTRGLRGVQVELTPLIYCYDTYETNRNEIDTWAINYHEGRGVNTAQAHIDAGGSLDAMWDVEFQTLVIRSLEWTSKHQIIHPIPDNFPTATETSLNVLF